MLPVEVSDGRRGLRSARLPRLPRGGAARAARRWARRRGRTRRRAPREPRVPPARRRRVHLRPARRRARGPRGRGRRRDGDRARPRRLGGPRPRLRVGAGAPLREPRALPARRRDEVRRVGARAAGALHGAPGLRPRRPRPARPRRPAPRPDARVHARGRRRRRCAHFLRTAGYLFVRGVFAPDEVAALLAEAEALRGEATPGDKLSWWAKDAAGARGALPRDAGGGEAAARGARGRPAGARASSDLAGLALVSTRTARATA